MRYKELLQEKVLGKDHFRDVNIDLGNFYANIDDLKASGKAAEITNKFQSMDALTRLGLFATKEFRLMPPTEKGSAGAYNPSRQDIRMAMDRVVAADKKAGTGSLLHELRHSAFAAISTDPSLTNAMPDDLKNRWRDGWGRNINYDKWTVLAKDVETTSTLPNGEEYTEKKDYDILAAPEHAMIYSIQLSNPMRHWRKIFFTTHPLIQDYDVDYWRDLYAQANDAVAQWMRDTVKDGRVMQGTFPSKGSSRDTARSKGRNITLSPTLERWYAALNKYKTSGIPGSGALAYAWSSHVTNWNGFYNNARLKRTTPALAKDIASMAELLTAIERGHLSEVPRWHRANRDNEGRFTRRIWRSLNEFYFTDTNIPWDDLDIRNFSKEEIDTVVSTGEPPKPKTSTTKSKPRKKSSTPPSKTSVEIMIKTHLNYIGNEAATRVARRQLEELAEKHGLDTSAIDGLVKLFKQNKAESYRSNVLAWAGV